MRALSGRYERRPIFAIFPATSKTALGHHGEEARKRSLPRRGTLRAQLSSTFSLSGKSPHPWLRFDEHLWLAVGFAKRAFDGIHWFSGVWHREGSNAEPKVENVMSAPQSHLKPEHEIKLSDAASVAQRAGF